MRTPVKLNIFTINLLLIGLALATMSACAQTESALAGVSTKEEPPKVGLRVLSVEPGGRGDEVGLQTMDVIARYGNFEIVETSSYFAAREAYEKFPGSKVELVYWRARERRATWIRPGRLGIQFNEYGMAAYQLDSLMQKLNVMIEAPDYFIESQTTKGAIQPRDAVINEITAAIEKARSDGSLTPAQMLVARIEATPDDAPQPEIDNQMERISELVTQQPKGFTDYLGYDVFFQHKRYRPAAACFRRALEQNPSDTGTRLNLGIAYFMLRQFAAADTEVDFVLKADDGLGEYGHAVAFQIKANAALGRRDFPAALNFAEKAFHGNPQSNYLMSLWQFAAAQTGDLQQFYSVVQATEKALPAEYEKLRCRTDAIEAYVLFKNNQMEKARVLVAKWKGTEKFDSNPKYWRQYPSGEDVLKIWEQLID